MMFSRTLMIAATSVTSAAALNVLKYTTTPNGFHNAPRGFNTWPIQANPLTTPSWTAFDEANVKSQCGVLAQPDFQAAGYKYCSLDSGWSQDGGDEKGRILYDPAKFDLPEFGHWLHDQGLLLGIYILPGFFCSDSNKTILGTDIPLSNIWNGNDNGFLRCDIDTTKDGSQEWHDSIIELFAEWGVDFIKMDFVTPGSPDNGGHLSADTSGQVIQYHKAIQKVGRPMRLDLSWKLDRSDKYYDIWKSNADSFRTDQDLNNQQEATFIHWEIVQRAIDNYRQYIELQIPKGQPLSIYPDLDNLNVGNPEATTGVSDVKRQTIMTHWIGTAANLISGSDLTSLDSFGRNLLTNPDAMAIADFTARYLMQPRNPGSGGTSAQQLQAWIAGPSDETGEAVVILANYGPDEGQGGFGQSLPGVQNVNATLEDLGIAGIARGNEWLWRSIWDGASGTFNDELSFDLDEGQSVLLRLTPTY